MSLICIDVANSGSYPMLTKSAKYTLISMQLKLNLYEIKPWTFLHRMTMTLRVDNALIIYLHNQIYENVLRVRVSF